MKCGNIFPVSSQNQNAAFLLMSIMTGLNYFLSITQELSGHGKNLPDWHFTAFALKFSLYSVFLDCLDCNIYGLMQIRAVRGSLAWVWGYPEKWVGVGQASEKSHSRQIFETFSSWSAEWQFLSCGAITKVSPGFNNSNSEGYLLAWSYWTNGISFYSSVRSIPVLIFFFLLSFQHSLHLPQSFLLSACSLVADLVPLPSVKEGVFTVPDYFRGSLQMEWKLSPFHLQFSCQPEVDSSDCLGNPV